MVRETKWILWILWRSYGLLASWIAILGHWGIARHEILWQYSYTGWLMNTFVKSNIVLILLEVSKPLALIRSLIHVGAEN